MPDWRPLDVMAIAGLVGLAIAGLGWAAAWHSVRSRQLELAAIGPDGLAAQTLGRVLAECLAPIEVVQEVIVLYRGLPSERGRELVYAIEGILTPNSQIAGASNRVVMVARTMAAIGSTPVAGK
jgi:hypothetical protein